MTDIDFYHEIQITAPQQTFDSFKRAIGQYIHIEILSPTILEIYEGEFYEESTTDGPLPYNSFSVKRLQKTGRTEWKSLYDQLLVKFKKLFAQKVKIYEATRNKVAAHYKVIYNTQVATNHLSGLSLAELEKGNIFNSLYWQYDNNPAWDGLSDLIEPGYLTAPTPKDWGLAHATLQQAYENLQVVDVSDYATIRNHMIKRYTATFKNMLCNLPYNYKDIDKAKYEGFFQLLMEKLAKTFD